MVCLLMILMEIGPIYKDNVIHKQLEF